MLKHSNNDYAEIKRQREELFKLILKKTGVKYSELLDEMVQNFIVNNLEVVTAAEKERFNKLVI
ncbi:MAG: hypothetical protein IJ894_06955 [Bacteroidales bacterium]|jgi:hypothetical protein|nr:hypothetical protein [Bacteroidales bacterium]